ncbi:uncharacterized protein LOC117326406 [Pecten maximus]|uniref:uncharacterized protein LOC117326406 n=1 Tax=Pecten maximus TaxID=6579 RepID=UPI00145833A5|nr:uncharacterized protein LOC117326406 [Pecten maximus]
MPPAKSQVWAYFKKINNDVASCDICKLNVAMSRGTTNLSTHLIRHHKINVAGKGGGSSEHHEHYLYPVSAEDMMGTLLQTLDIRYRAPNRHTVSDTLIPAVLQQEKEKLFLELSQAKGVSLTSDAWTSRATESYITITCHFVRDWELKSKVLQT